MAHKGNTTHHNINSKHKDRDGKKRYRSSHSSIASTETPLKRQKDCESIRSPTIFEILDNYNIPHTMTNRGDTSFDVDVDDATLLLNRVLNNIDNISKRLDTYHVKVKDVDSRLSDVECTFNSIDVKLDINNKLLLCMIKLTTHQRGVLLYQPPQTQNMQM